MAMKMLVSEVLTSPPPKPPTKPSTWEKYLLNLINQLQQSNVELHKDLNQAKQHIQQLQEQITNPGTQVEDTTNTQSPPATMEKVISEINERSYQTWRKNKIRVGGLS